MKVIGKQQTGLLDIYMRRCIMKYSIQVGLQFDLLVIRFFIGHGMLQIYVAQGLVPLQKIPIPVVPMFWELGDP